MLKKQKFVNEFTKQEFDTEEEAKKSESRYKDIKSAFSFYKCGPRDGNDSVGVKRSVEFYNKLLDTLILMVKKYEPWIVKHYKEQGVELTRNNTKGYSMLGRFLGDGNSDLYYWWCIQANICPICIREFGQMYYALHCKHDGKNVE